MAKFCVEAIIIRIWDKYRGLYIVCPSALQRHTTLYWTPGTLIRGEMWYQCIHLFFVEHFENASGFNMSRIKAKREISK